jgi:hypothetical protein
MNMVRGALARWFQHSLIYCFSALELGDRRRLLHLRAMARQESRYDVYLQLPD